MNPNRIAEKCGERKRHRFPVLAETCREPSLRRHPFAVHVRSLFAITRLGTSAHAPPSCEAHNPPLSFHLLSPRRSSPCFIIRIPSSQVPTQYMGRCARSTRRRIRTIYPSSPQKHNEHPGGNLPRRSRLPRDPCPRHAAKRDEMARTGFPKPPCKRRCEPLLRKDKQDEERKKEEESWARKRNRARGSST